jgi:hypothetical protein
LTPTRVRVLVLGGRGKHFSAGADLNWMRRAAQGSEADNLADARRFARMLQRLATMSKPTIARVQGAALGGGTGLAAACDMAVASSDASFATSEVKFGIIPAVISPYVLRAIGPRQALRYFQSAEKISAERALMMGLVSEVTAPDALDAGVTALVEPLLAGGPWRAKGGQRPDRSMYTQSFNVQEPPGGKSRCTRRCRWKTPSPKRALTPASTPTARSSRKTGCPRPTAKRWCARSASMRTAKSWACCPRATGSAAPPASSARPS